MKLYEKLKLKDKEVISIVGGGGKTTLLEELSKQLNEDGKKVLVTTTTKIGIPKNQNNMYINTLQKDIDKSNIVYFGEYMEGGRLVSKDISVVDKLIKNTDFDYYIIEADGAKRKPIKASNDTEPVYTKYTTTTIGVIGLDCLNKPIDQIVHRSKIFRKIIKPESDLVSIDDIVKLVLHKKGLFKDSLGRKILYLNKTINKEDGLIIKEKLKDEDIDIYVNKFNIRSEYDA